MSRQMPELYLRGAIFNKTMKNLTQKQIDEVERRIDILLKTPSLTKSREKFCQTLANTIGADYREDKSAALQEYKIALMKAVIYVLYHKPNHQILDDPIQTRKMFSQFTYNYMKQILNENKIPKNVINKYVEDEPYIVAYEQIKNLLEKEGIFRVDDYKGNKITIEGDIGIIDMKTAKKIGNIKKKYEKMGVEIKTSLEKIEITKKKSHPIVNTKIRYFDKMRVVSFESDDDETSEINRNNIEFEISKNNSKKNDEFDPNHMRRLMPDHLVQIYDIIMDSDSIPNKSDIAKFLDISVSEVNKRLNQMKCYYYASK